MSSVFATLDVPLIALPNSSYYYTQMIGDARVPPTIAASSDFSGIAVIGECSSQFERCGVPARRFQAFQP